MGIPGKITRKAGVAHNELRHDELPDPVREYLVGLKSEIESLKKEIEILKKSAKK